MNVLFVLYGPLASNSGVPLALHARELAALGHPCAVALPPPEAGAGAGGAVAFAGRAVTFDEALRNPHQLFPDGRPADVVHAWTPRENVRRFVTAWLSRHPAPLVVYLEDNERCIALEPLGGEAATLLRASDDDLAALLPDHLPHPYRFESFVGLADAAVVIQGKLAADVPPWVPCTEVMPGVDLAVFAPAPAPPGLRERHGVAPGERVIVYPGALNPHTRAPMLALCEAVALLNAEGVRCRLLRTGPFRLDFLDQLPPPGRQAIADLGVVPRAALPQLLALADVLVQPGRRDAFEDLRLPGKLPEFLAMGKPVVLPDANVAHLLADGVDVLVTRTGTPQEIAARCRQLFEDPALSARLGAAARRFAEAHFDPRRQAAALLAVYEQAVRTWDAAAARQLWAGATEDTPPAVLLARRPGARTADTAALLPMHRELLQLARQQLGAGAADVPQLRRILRERAAEVVGFPALAGDCAETLALLDAGSPAGAARPAGHGLQRAGSVARRLRAVVRQKGGAGAVLGAAWRIAASEGWPGMRRRAAALHAAARLGAGAETPRQPSAAAPGGRSVPSPAFAASQSPGSLASDLPTVHVLLATWNGERFLRPQWHSIAAQEGVRVVLHIADDGSTDGTLALLRELEAGPRGAIAQVQWLEAPPRRSAARSFLQLLATAIERHPEAKWFAFCDQDDVWLPGKLAAALEVLAPHGHADHPALYGGRTVAVDEDDREGGLSPLFERPPEFRNAVAQSIMGGNTMLLNRATALLMATGPMPEVVSHDWWCYQLVSGAGGFIHYDARPFVRYRQHGNNAVGSNLGWRARWTRFQRLLRGDYRQWNRLHVDALAQRADVLTSDSTQVLQAFARAREAGTVWERAAWLRRSGVFRQTLQEQAMLWLACVLRRM